MSRQTGGLESSIQARVLITTEQRRNHDEAVRRLEEIAAEVGTRPTFVVIGGWPALERRHSEPLPRRGPQEPGVPQNEPRRISLRVTVAVAAGDLLVRAEGTLEPGAAPALADQVSAIGRSLTFAHIGDPAGAARVVRGLNRRPLRLRPQAQPPAAAPAESRPPLSLTPALPTAGVPVNAQVASGELEIAVSNNGQTVVVATNGGYSVSTNSGATFNFVGGTPAAFPANGDPSLAVGASGTFYYGFIAFPNGTAPANNVTGCSTGISVSANGTQAFTFRNHATLCPQTGNGICFPDQEHIAADRVNASANGGDQVYSVWRNFVPVGPPAPNATCGGIGSGFVTPSIVCSNDGGANWGGRVVIGTGDIPRVTVGQDGFVYVVYRNGTNLMLNKFSSCNAGLAQQTGFPVTVAPVADVTCPVAGLDRCNDGNSLSSHTVAVDDTNPNHVYVAYANNTAAGNEDIIVRDSLDGGANWSRAVRVNSAAAGRRFMPWVCTLNGSAFVSWYDRRTAGAANNDATNYYLGVATGRAITLQAGPEYNLSVNADPQCASRWPCRPRATADSESCSVQPQLAGRCSVGGAACDFSQGCPPGQGACQTGGGCPKYGDYNGNACAAGRIYTAWASATSPPGLPAVARITTFSSAFTTPRLTVNKRLSPPGIASSFDLKIDGVTVVSRAGDGDTSGPRIVSIGTHIVGESSSFPPSFFNKSVGGDCAPNGSVTLAEGESKTCTITNTMTPLGVFMVECLANCEAERDACLAQVGEPGGPLPRQCVQAFIACRRNCVPPPPPRLTVVKVLTHPGDPGRFNLQIDGVTRATNVGNGGTTGPVEVSPGTHTVAETAGAGTNPANYTVVIGGDCAADGSITLADGDNRTCTITNTGPPPPRLTVNKVLAPAGDPGRFNLLIDGVSRAGNVGGGGSTGAVVVSVGAHTVGETPGPGTNAADYTTVIGGDCAPNGSVSIAPSDNKTYTITNTLKPRAQCLRECAAERDACMALVGTPGGPLARECVQAFMACRRGCPP